MRRAGGLHRRRRAPAPPRDRRDRRGHDRPQEVRLSLHQRAAAGKEARPVQAQPVSSPGRSISTATAQMHDKSVCQEGVYDRAVAAIKARQGQGLPRQHQLHAVRRRRAGRWSRTSSTRSRRSASTAITVSPGYAYERAPDQQHFLNRGKTKNLFREIFRRGARARPGRSASRRCSSISSPATRPITARPGATRRATCSAGSGPAICSAKATPRPSRS